MSNRCRFAAPMTLAAFQIAARQGHDAHVCAASRVPRFPRNVRRLAHFVPRTCCPLSVDPWGPLGSWCIETSAAARFSVPVCRDRGDRRTIRYYPLVHWNCGIMRVWREEQADNERRAAEGNRARLVG